MSHQTVNQVEGQEEPTQEEVDAKNEQLAEAKVRAVNLASIFYLFNYMILFFAALHIY